MPGPLPKPPGQARRQNKESAWTELPAERRGAIPKLPAKAAGDWHDHTRAWWNALWRSPMATTYIDADFDTILGLAMMLDAETRGEGGVTLRREARYLEDAFGLNPASRARLRWEIGPEGGADAQPL